MLLSLRIVWIMSGIACALSIALGASLVYGQATCNGYGSGATPPVGYGAAWNVLSSAKELLLSSTCDASSAVFTVGGGQSTQYVYHKGYTYAGQWNPFTLSGTYVSNSTVWLSGTGTYTFQNPPQVPNTYWVGYICQWTSSQWKCGCADSVCASNFWQLQTLTMPQADDEDDNSTGGSTGPDRTMRALGNGITIPTGTSFSTFSISAGDFSSRVNARGGQMTPQQAQSIMSGSISTIFPQATYGGSLKIEASGNLRLGFTNGGTTKFAQLTDSSGSTRTVSVQWPQGFNATPQATAFMELLVNKHFSIQGQYQTNLNEFR